jgi:predicted enzyme related to lactoylglutathione lyase
MSRIPLVFVPLIALLLISGCATEPRWPAITEPANYQQTPGRWVWAELITADVAAAKAFYGAMFDWQFETLGRGEKTYTLIRHHDLPLGGIVYGPQVADVAPAARWLGLASVTDVEQAALLAAQTGGAVLVAPRELPGRGEVAVLEDPEGARFAVLDSTAGDPPDEFPAAGQFLWRELWAGDGARMAAFYAQVIGAEIDQVDASPPDLEWHLRAGGFPRAGVLQQTTGDLPSAWLHYVRVDNLATALKRANELGAIVVVEPDPNIRQGAVAVLIDPMGGAIGLAEWRDELDSESEQ